MLRGNLSAWSGEKSENWEQDCARTKDTARESVVTAISLQVREEEGGGMEEGSMEDEMAEQEELESRVSLELF